MEYTRFHIKSHWKTRLIFFYRCKPLLSSYNSKFITYYNWIFAGFKESYIHEAEEKMCKGTFYRKNKCLEMTENTVWFCDDNNVFAYNRAKNGTIKKNKMIVGNNNTFIKSIALSDDYIISGDVDGIIKHWKIESEKDRRNYLKYSVIHNVHEQIDLIDATSQHIITGSENFIKILKYTNDKTGCTEENEIFCEADVERLEMQLLDHDSCVESISFDPIGTKFAASSYDLHEYYNPPSTFLIYDIEKNYHVMVKKFGDNCLQLLWEDPQTILMCFKYYIKKMDIRTSEVVRTWDTSNYEELLMCCSSDNQYTFMTGYSKVILWDQRQSDAIQTYTMEHDDKSISALEFDNSHIYVVKHEDLYELDFTGKQHFDHKKIKKLFGNFY